MEDNNEVKEPAPKYNYISPDEYLEMERASEERHEYYDGYVVTLNGASLKHNYIAGNIYAEIGSFLKETSCQLLPSNMRVGTPSRDAYIYPDALIVCGDPKLEDDKFDTLLNPVVVFEILSPSTQKNDLGYKFLYYQRIPSIKEYVIIDSRKRAVQVARKQADRSWKFEPVIEAIAGLHIATINFKISLDDIYRHTGL